jgi:hypothetical protein
MNLRIETLDRSELDKVVALFLIVWGGEPGKVKAKTEWAFDNDFSKVLVFKNEADEIIAVRGGFKWPLQYNGHAFDCYQFHGTCVHPDYRRLGLFSKLNKAFLAEAEAEGSELIFNVSVTASKLGYEKLGWHYLKGFHRLTKVHTVNAITQKRASKLAPALRDTLPDTLIAARESQFSNRIHTRYTGGFLDWRLKNAEEEYRILQMEGAAVLYKMRLAGNRSELVIGDVFLEHRSYRLFKKAVRAVFAREKPDLSLVYIFSGHPYYRYFLRLLYLPNPFRFHLHFGTKTLKSRLDIAGLEWGSAFLDIDTF